MNFLCRNVSVNSNVFDSSSTKQLKRSNLPLLCFALLLLTSATVGAQDTALPIPNSGVIGVDQAMLTPDYWIARTSAPNKILMTPQQIKAINGRTYEMEPSTHDVTKLGSTATREQVLSWIKEATPVSKPFFDVSGNEVSKADIDAIVSNIGTDQIPASSAIRYGLSVRRAQLRLYPTSLRVFPRKDLLDFESFQGGILFPGEPVAIAHASVDGNWYLVYSTQGPAWVARTDIAEGTADQVFSYQDKKPYRIVTGDKVWTVFTPEAPEVSEYQLDMGVRVPIADLPADKPVNGQGPYESWAIELPVRHGDGSLGFTPALLQMIKDSSENYLPLTRANIIRQSFKFLGERYGWGHLYNARDCSGFTAEVYRSMGIFLPPNSGAQGYDPALKHRSFSDADSHRVRVKAVLDADVGDLVVVPGHVLMILGKVNGQPYVIQDVPYAVFRDTTGKIRMTKVNEVSVTPLLPLFADEKHTYVDAMTSLVHVSAQY